MSVADITENKQLICEFCNFRQFATFSEFNLHHLTKHIRQPSVVLVKLNDRLSNRLLQGQFYKLNTGVARKSRKVELVSPLRITVSKVPGQKTFTVLKTGATSTPGVKEELSSTSKVSQEAVEGNKLLERFGASISYGPKIKSEAPNDKNEGKVKSVVDKDKLLERLSGIGGISISSKAKSSSNDNKPEEKIVEPVSVGPKIKSIDISQLKSLKKEETPEKGDKKVDNTALLQRLSGIGGISIGQKLKTESKPASSEEEEEEEEDEEDEEDESEEEDINQDSNGSVNKISVGGISITKKIKSDENKSETDAKSLLLKLNSLGVLNNHKKAKEETTEKTSAPDVLKLLGNSISVGQKSKPVVKPKEDPVKEASESVDEKKEDKPEPEKVEESGRDILERLAVAQSNKEPVETKPAEPEIKNLNANMETQQMDPHLPISPSPSEQLHPDFIAPPSECNSPADGQYELQNQQDPQQQQEQQLQQQQSQNLTTEPPGLSADLLLTPSDSSHDSTEYTMVAADGHEAYLQEGYTQEQVGAEGATEQMYGAIDPNDPNQQGGEQMQQAYWTENAVVDENASDPLMHTEGVPANGESVSQALRESLLQNFLEDTQQVQSDGSEYMSLDRLGMEQPQQQQQQYETAVADPTGQPMQQLAQQVQRMQNPPSQISVVPSHQLLAQPQPPPMHAAPQHHSPQASPYDPMAHMQQQMPPLYQGYSMYNQNNFQVHQNMAAPQPRFQSPAPPRPTMQQRPQMPNRQFPGMVRGQLPRQRPMAPLKRAVPRMSSPQMMAESSPQKQRRLDVPGGGVVRSNQQTPPKLPSGLTITPPKKTTEANKVANVLASRGITVTPNRQPPTQQANRPMQRPGVGQQRTSGGFAVPGPRRSGGAIVNHNVERPERCTTVDLTLDDDPPPARNRVGMGRFPCNQCTKIFTSAIMLENHKATHRAAGTLAFKCDKCPAQYPNAQALKQHKISYHKTMDNNTSRVPPELCLPIVDLSQAGVRDQLSRVGIYNYVPLSQLRSNSNGIYGIPIATVDSSKDKVASNLNTFGANNYFMLGKIRSLNR